MKQNINESEFIQAFVKMGRENNFSYEARQALFNYLTSLEEDTGTEIELDVIAICCEYSEYESLEAFQNDYGEDYESLEDIEERTTVIRIDDDAFIIVSF